jgi:dephospho-CoA kinase
MKWIGLTGGIGSGKSTAAQMLTDAGYTLVDADRIAHEVVEKGTTGLRSVVRGFGPDVLTATGELDRPKLGRMVFGDPIALQKLEFILHPLIRQQVVDTKAQLQDQGVKIAFYDVPLLFEKNMQDQFTAVVVVDCTPEQQFQRTKKRSPSLTDDEIQMRLASQFSLLKKTEQADFVVHNDGDFSQLKVEVEQLIAFVENLED